MILEECALDVRIDVGLILSREFDVSRQLTEEAGLSFLKICARMDAKR